jgi:hypothetical protein
VPAAEVERFGCNQSAGRNTAWTFSPSVTLAPKNLPALVQRQRYHPAVGIALESNFTTKGLDDKNILVEWRLLPAALGRCPGL